MKSRSFWDLIDKFLEHLEEERNYSGHTVSNYRRDLNQFGSFCEENFDSLLVTDLKIEELKAFQYELFQQGLKSTSILRKLSSLRSFYSWMYRKGILETNWAKFLVSPKSSKKLPQFLFEGEMSKILAEPLGEDLFSLRDYLLFEILYCTGMRVSELGSLQLSHFKPLKDRFVIRGKGSKERLVFLSRQAMEKIPVYLELRSQLVSSQVSSFFVSKAGNALSVRGIQYLVDQYLQKLGIFKKVSPHVLRHSFATHLINQGADIRSVQELLGHASLGTTQVYTHISRSKMKESLLNFHPRGKDS